MRTIAGLALCLALVGCASNPGKVALLADEGGGVGAVALLDPATGAERGQLTAANTEAGLAGTVRARPLSGNYDALLATMPAAPKIYTLYFTGGGTQLTAESVQVLNELRALVTPASDVQITGHTDTTGDAAANDKLSLDRALQVRDALVQQGLPVGNAKVTGRGERELRVPTARGVNEAANRRVEVIIR